VTNQRKIIELAKPGRGFGVVHRAAKRARQRDPKLFEEIERISKRAHAAGLFSPDRYTEATYLSELYALIHNAKVKGNLDRTLKDLIDMRRMCLDPRANIMAVFLMATADIERQQQSKFALKLSEAASRKLNPAEFARTFRKRRS
jgi:hypothetical protein